MRPTMIRPRYYVGKRDTRWDVYPQVQPEQVVAHDCHGFWAKAENGSWYKSPASYCLLREITEQEANASLE